MREGAFQPAKSMVLGNGLAMSLRLLGEPLGRDQLHLLTGNGVGIVEGEDIGLRPASRPRMLDFVGSDGVFRISLGIGRRRIELGISPASVKIALPHWPIVQDFDFPNAVFL